MPSSPLEQFNGKLIDGLEFCSMAYKLFESIRNTPEGPSLCRLRPRPVKKLLEEILPICKYVQANYRPGRYLSVQWIDGSQNFDAKVIQKGAYISENYYPEISYLEVTCSMHQNEYLIRKLLNVKGEAFGVDGVRRLKSGEIESAPVSYTNSDFVEADALLILKRIEEKSIIDYPNNTTLIVDCTLNLPYMRNEWESLMDHVRCNLPKSKFCEIYLYNPLKQYSLSIFP